MKNSQVKIFLGIIAVLILGTIVAVVLNFSGSAPSGPGKYDDFAKCLKSEGAIFYGAFWCPHCQAQKKDFGSSEQYLPYVECSTPDAQSQTQVCIDKKIESYPTWVFPDGSRLSGEIPMQTLSEKTSCPLPGAETSPGQTQSVLPGSTPATPLSPVTPVR